MNEDNHPATEGVPLRRRAEDRLREKLHLESEEDPRRLVHELQVHQIELELQNSELRKARDELESALEKYTDLYDFAPVGYLTLDRNGTILALNVACSGLIGIERSHLIGRSLEYCVHAGSRPALSGFLERVFSSPVKETCQLALREKSNSPQFVHIEGVTAESGEECRIALIDITERKLAEDERKKAVEHSQRLNRLYRVLSEINEAIVRTKDRDTLFHDFCRIAVEEGCFKLAWAGLVEEGSGGLKIVAAKGEAGFLDGIRHSVSRELAGCGTTAISIREGTDYICNDFLGSPVSHPWHELGQTHGIRAAASIVLKQEGRVIGALTLYSDKKDFFDREQVELLRQMGTDISFALDNIIRKARRLEAERALRVETIERLRAMEALREKEQLLIQQSRLAAMGEMIGNIAHQWRQPLNTLGLIVQQLPLLSVYGELTKESMDDVVSQSMGIINHMSKTIDDFRDYFRPDKEKAEFKVKDAIVNTLSLIEDSFKVKHIAIEIVVNSEPVINGYRNEYAQVILNILNNARDALTEREIKDPKVTINIGSEGDKSVVSISDNAGGIPEEIIGKIFEPYFTTKGPQGGTGVGLFMSQNIITKSMGGTLTVRNSANGAEFRIEV